jgi:hypothetical protein
MLGKFKISSNCWLQSQLKPGSETNQVPNSPKVQIITLNKKKTGVGRGKK